MAQEACSSIISNLFKESDIVNNQRILNRITKEGFVIKDNSKALEKVLDGNFALVTTGFEYLGINTYNIGFFKFRYFVLSCRS